MNIKKSFILFLWLFACLYSLLSYGQSSSTFRVVGYYSGVHIPVDSFETDKLTHLIFCFGNLEKNRLKIHTAADSAIIQQMVKRKMSNPSLKVMLSLGGWGGCKTCSDVFNTTTGRKEFALSVKEISNYFKTDGLDLDWEYPAIKGVPEHTFRKEDRANFTALVKELREVNGKNFELSFAAGGFTQYINESIDWKQVIKYVNFINIMSYDLVHGYSTSSGHHTPLYSTPLQIESTNNAVQLLLKKGVPAKKLVIGAAFYGRFFKITEGHQVDLYQPCKFSHAFSSKHTSDTKKKKNDFELKWDPIAQAPYAINTKRRLLASYDDEKSIALKTKYALDKKLGGIMFWQLFDDQLHNGLLNIIYSNLK